MFDKNAVQKHPRTQTRKLLLITAGNTSWAAGQQMNSLGFFKFKRYTRDFASFKYRWPHALALKMLLSSSSFFQLCLFAGVHVCDVKKFLIYKPLLQNKYLWLKLMKTFSLFKTAIKAQSSRCCFVSGKIALLAGFLFAMIPPDLIFFGT